MLPLEPFAFLGVGLAAVPGEYGPALKFPAGTTFAATPLTTDLLLSLLTEGLSNKEIGERMCLAEKTVKNYVSRVLKALDMHSRAQAALYASANPGLKSLVYS